MPRTSSYVSVTIDTAEDPQVVSTESDLPFCVLVTGSFSGGTGRNRRIIEIDRDNFEEVLALVAPQVEVMVGKTPVTVSIRELDDFHPDHLFANLAPFEALRKLRRRLSDPATFAAAAAEIAPRAESAGADLSKVSGADLLRMMTGDAPAPARTPVRSDWDQMLHELVAPYAERAQDPRQAELVAQTDAAIAGHMRAILHHPAFQNLEAAWRGLYFLTRRLETGEQLKVYLLDLSQEDLATDAGLAVLRRQLTEEAWSVIAGLYYFAPQDESTLLRLAPLARGARAPFLAGLAPDVVGLSQVFSQLRQSEDARWVGLALPRFLLRLPYGADSSAVESFEFEEMPSPPQHERYLWGHPAIACAYLLGDAFTRYGWDFRPGVSHTIDDLPVHVFKRDGVSEAKPCGEVLLTEQAAEMLLERGLIPLVSIKESDRVRVVRFQSVADPAMPLAGRWG